MNDWGRDEDEAAEALAWLADRALGRQLMFLMPAGTWRLRDCLPSVT